MPVGRNARSKGAPDSPRYKLKVYPSCFLCLLFGPRWMQMTLTVVRSSHSRYDLPRPGQNRARIGILRRLTFRSHSHPHLHSQPHIHSPLHSHIHCLSLVAHTRTVQQAMGEKPCSTGPSSAPACAAREQSSGSRDASGPITAATAPPSESVFFCEGQIRTSCASDASKVQGSPDANPACASQSGCCAQNGQK